MVLDDRPGGGTAQLIQIAALAFETAQFPAAAVPAIQHIGADPDISLMIFKQGADGEIARAAGGAPVAAEDVESIGLGIVDVDPVSAGSDPDRPPLIADKGGNAAMADALRVERIGIEIGITLVAGIKPHQPSGTGQP